LIELGIVLVLVLLNGLFALSELAVVLKPYERSSSLLAFYLDGVADTAPPSRLPEP
jgi:hypothetical protein